MANSPLPTIINEDSGRPTVMTPEVLAKLDEGFCKGLTDGEACLYAGISRGTLYNYQRENPDFLDRKNELRENPTMTAKLNIVREIDRGNKHLSQWWLEHRSPEFRTEKKGDGPTINLVQILQGIKQHNGQLASGQEREDSEPLLDQGQEREAEIVQEEQSAGTLQPESLVKKHNLEIETTGNLDG